ncbi:MAG: GNAT family N-acetyltransferase [Pseudomonadota bacterium]
MADRPTPYLRAVTPEDLVALRAVFGDPEVMRYSDSGVRDDAMVAEWIARHSAMYPAGLGKRAICVAGVEGPIGYTGLVRDLDRHRPDELEIGYRLARAWWGRGIITTANRLAIAAPDRPDAARIVAIIDPGNAGSIAAARKLGMTYRREAMFPGYDHPDHVYGVDLPLPPA